MEVVIVPKDVWETAVALAMSGAGAREEHGGSDIKRWPEPWQDVVRFYNPEAAQREGLKDPYKYMSVLSGLEVPWFSPAHQKDALVRANAAYQSKPPSTISIEAAEEAVPEGVVLHALCRVQGKSKKPVTFRLLPQQALDAAIALLYVYNVYQGAIAEAQPAEEPQSKEGTSTLLASTSTVALSVGGYYNAHHPVRDVDGTPRVIVPDGEDKFAYATTGRQKCP